MSPEQEIQILEGLEAALLYGASEEEVRDWFAWWNTSRWIEANGGHERLETPFGARKA